MPASQGLGITNRPGPAWSAWTFSAFSIGRNAVAYPAGGRTGENCLIATKAMVPLDGPIRANAGLLGWVPVGRKRLFTTGHIEKYLADQEHAAKPVQVPARRTR